MHQYIGRTGIEMHLILNGIYGLYVVMQRTFLWLCWQINKYINNIKCPLVHPQPTRFRHYIATTATHQ